MNGQHIVQNTKENALILKKHNALIHCEGKLSLMQRKISNVLLFNSLATIHSQNEFQMSLRDLCALVGYKSNDRQFVKVALRALVTTAIEWNLLNDKLVKEDSDDKLQWNISTYLSGATIEGGQVSYSYSPQMKNIIAKLAVFSPINLYVQTLFNSSYSLALYENCIRYLKIKQTAWMTLDLFRKLMGLDNSKYPKYKDLKRNVIDIAVKEINNKSDITIKPFFKKYGKKVLALQFRLSEKNSISVNLIEDDVRNVTDDSSISLASQLNKECGFSIQKAKVLLSKYGLEKIKEKLCMLQMEKSVNNPKGWMISALENNYRLKPKKENVFFESNRSEKNDSLLNEERINLNRYKRYKLYIYLQSLKSQEPTHMTEILHNFINSMDSIASATFRKSKFDKKYISEMFIIFINKNYGLIVEDHFSLEDFIENKDANKLFENAELLNSKIETLTAAILLAQPYVETAL